VDPSQLSFDEFAPLCTSITKLGLAVLLIPRSSLGDKVSILGSSPFRRPNKVLERSLDKFFRLDTEHPAGLIGVPNVSTKASPVTWAFTYLDGAWTAENGVGHGIGIVEIVQGDSLAVLIVTQLHLARQRAFAITATARRHHPVAPNDTSKTYLFGFRKASKRGGDVEMAPKRIKAISVVSSSYF
jgi:hypothetical protein